MKLQTRHAALLARLAIALAIIPLLASCGSDLPPLDRIRAEFDSCPEYSVVLEDMEDNGAVFDRYSHTYRVIYATEAGTVDKPPTFEEAVFQYGVDEATYKKYESNLDMVVLAKKPDGTIVTTPQPLGYEQVGDKRYGEWKTDTTTGRHYWGWNRSIMPFFLGYAMGGGLGPRVYRNDYDDYRYHSQRGSSYYGPKDASGNSSYGTRGTATMRNPTFFERQQARAAARGSSFADRVDSRMGRSQGSSFRSRSSGGGGK